MLKMFNYVKWLNIYTEKHSLTAVTFSINLAIKKRGICA